MKPILLATAFILAPAGLASAADTNEGQAAYDWSGSYAGVDVGYAVGSSDHLVTSGGGDLNSPIDPNGFIGGIHIGLNREMASRFVLGAEADLMYTAVDGQTAFGSGGGALGKGEVKWSGSARLRAGYAYDRTLPYITAGVAAARYQVLVTTGGFGGDQPYREETHVGWTVGGGVEHALSDRWIARVEYRYSDFGSKALSAVNGFTTETHVDLQTHDIRVGLSYKF
ncbi:porin family protein [Mesorhizobium sp. M4B.F.Ca.ET.019.03.1.1]|uniref:outer membrane protein n=1 Tax=Mesorhizobium sp. M4B.F.Ca.ET.019.03.1.1 TaxID=2496651 RepID=UPI000FCC217C|nr:outer membrane protein [Mesorhizobium sp. M4B.F.Ca.ET.019.03.1.1]RVD41485.1 porin family protein [Mesorhizobium sp. M4B.F.Ca.ET.019.03.1.1]